MPEVGLYDHLVLELAKGSNNVNRVLLLRSGDPSRLCVFAVSRKCRAYRNTKQNPQSEIVYRDAKRQAQRNSDSDSLLLVHRVYLLDAIRSRVQKFPVCAGYLVRNRI
jgi:hypothetical protein